MSCNSTSPSFDLPCVELSHHGESARVNRPGQVNRGKSHGRSISALTKPFTCGCGTATIPFRRQPGEVTCVALSSFPKAFYHLADPAVFSGEVSQALLQAKCVFSVNVFFNGCWTNDRKSRISVICFLKKRILRPGIQYFNSVVFVPVGKSQDSGGGDHVWNLLTLDLYATIYYTYSTHVYSGSYFHYHIKKVLKVKPRSNFGFIIILDWCSVWKDLDSHQLA